jgi:phosphonate transport system substrate-binding protein
MKYKASFYPWITQNVDAKDIFKNISILLELTSQELSKIVSENVSIELLQPMEVPRQIQSIANNECDIAFMNPLGFIFSNQVNSKVEALSVVERQIDGTWGTTYFAQIYTSKKTALNKGDFTKKMKGRTIGFGVPFSTSNFIIPAYELKLKGINSMTTFTRLEFYGGHDLVAKAVYDGKVDIGAGHDGVIIDLSNQYSYGDADEKLVRLLKSSPIPSDPIAVNIADNTQKQNLQQAFELASKTPDGEKAIAKFWGGARHLLKANTNDYVYLLTAVKELGLMQSDLIG